MKTIKALISMAAMMALPVALNAAPVYYTLLMPQGTNAFLPGTAATAAVGITNGATQLSPTNLCDAVTQNYVVDTQLAPTMTVATKATSVITAGGSEAGAILTYNFIGSPDGTNWYVPKRFPSLALTLSTNYSGTTSYSTNISCSEFRYFSIWYATTGSTNSYATNMTFQVLFK